MRSFIVTGRVTPMRSHCLARIARHILLVRFSDNSGISSLLKEYLSVSLFHLFSYKSMTASHFDWSTSLLLECQVLFSNFPFFKMESIPRTTSLASFGVDLDPAISSTYTCRSSWAAASFSSDPATLAKTLIDLEAISGAGLSPKLRRNHW